MAVTRRQLLTGAGVAAGTHLLLPAVVRGSTAFGDVDPATRNRNRLLVFFLLGGNDGLNTVVPTGDVRGEPRLSVYRAVRPELAFEPAALLKLDRGEDRDHKLGLHPALKTVHKLYRDGRTAIVQGVHYPGNSFSHEVDEEAWHTGAPDQQADSGWIGRHLDRVRIGEGEMRAVSIGYRMPLILRGRKASGINLASIEATRFSDGFGAEASARHASLPTYASWPRTEPVRVVTGRGAKQAHDMVASLKKSKVPKGTNNQLVDLALTARTLYEQNLGVESVFLYHGGFDTHFDQAPEHQRLLTGLDNALEAFFFGTINGASIGAGPLNATVASRMIVMVISEFGRRIGENGGGSSAGTDHGASAPVIMIGPKGAGSTGRRLVGGLHGDHPKMGTTAAPADNLKMTTDLRRVYQSVLAHWFHNPEPAYGSKYGAIPGLFR